MRTNVSRSFNEAKLRFYQSLVGLTTDLLGDSSVGSHLSILTDLLDSRQEYEVSDMISAVTLCTFGPAPRLCRSSHSLASVATAHPTLRLARRSTDDLLCPFASIRPST